MAETPGAPSQPVPANPAPDADPDTDRCTAIRDDLPAHALGALDAAAARQVEAHLAGCVRCLADLVQLEHTVGLLGTVVAPVPPRPEVRAALMSAIAEAPTPLPTPLPMSAPIRLAERRNRRWLWRVGLPAVACLAVLALVAVAVLALLLDSALEERDDAQEAQRRIAAYLGEGGTLSPLLPEAGAAADVEGGHGSLAIAPNQSRAMLVVHRLAPSEDGVAYVAWAERGGERVRLGEVPVDGEGLGYLTLYGPEPINTYDRVGISRYPPGASKGEPFLVATVPSDAKMPPSTPVSPIAETAAWW